jgi:hypothetical protein
MGITTNTKELRFELSFEISPYIKYGFDKLGFIP